MKMTKWAVFSSVFFAFIIGAISSHLIILSVFAHGGNTNFAHGCVGNLTCLLRVVSPTTNCLGGETALDWSQNGIGNFGGFVTDQLVNISSGNGGGDAFDYRMFDGGNFTGSEFVQNSMKNASFVGTNFTNVSFNDSNLDGSNFTSANLMGVQFVNTANSTVNTNFTNANFTNAILEGNDFSSATVTGATWDNTTCPDGTNSDSNGNTCEGHLTP